MANTGKIAGMTGGPTRNPNYYIKHVILALDEGLHAENHI